MIIGLVGKAGSGKDTVADHLVKNYGFTKASFARPLKEVLSRLFDMSWDQLNKQELKEVVDERYGITPRWLMQQFGTEFCRKIYPNIWVDLLIREYRKEPEARWVVSDVRFCNEAQIIEDAGGQVWRIVCSDNPKTAKLREATHAPRGLVARSVQWLWHCISPDHPKIAKLSEHASEVEQDRITTSQTLTARYGDLPGLYAQADTGVREFLALPRTSNPH